MPRSTPRARGGACARALSALALALATALVSASAAADDCPYSTSSSDAGLFGVEAFTSMWRQIPALQVQSENAPPHLMGLYGPESGGQTLGGVGADFGFRACGLVVRVIEVRYAAALLGMANAGMQTANDAPVDMRLGPMQVVEIGLPLLGSGWGFQVFTGRFKASGLLNWGWVRAWAPVTMRDATHGVSQSTVTAQSGYVRAQLDACMRTGRSWPSGASSWACLTASSNVYEFDPFSNFSFGVRLDL